MEWNVKLADKIARMKAWAQANYEKGADTFVECYEQREWEEFFKGHDGRELTMKEAMKCARTCVSVWNERRANARIEGGW